MCAQTIITGKVASANGKPVQAFVSLSAKGSETTESYADADERGRYKTEYRGEADSLALTVSGMGFGSITRMVANRSQAVDFTVAEKGYTLREVVVKAQKIREEGDTLNYNVAAYRGQTDRVIGDVLKKMPGTEVSESGGIKFNGKPIKNFYVENMDLLQSRYGIATNNISAEDVTVVQVMQNHQPIRAIKDLKPSEDVAINLKLRQQAKGAVILTGMAGVGEAGHGHGDHQVQMAIMFCFPTSPAPLSMSWDGAGPSRLCGQRLFPPPLGEPSFFRHWLVPHFSTQPAFFHLKTME